MAIITKPVSIDKGTENVITLNKADLASDAKVVADSYFSDQNNWKSVYVVYKSTLGNQVNDVVFDPSESSPTGNFNPSLKSFDTWEVQSITILDFDNGSLYIFRDDLTVVDFDINLGDLIAPTLTSVSIISNNVDTTKSLTGDEITMSFTSSEPIQNISASIKGQVATILNTSGDNWEASITTNSSGPQGLVSFTIDFEDLAGNVGVQVNSTTDGSSVSHGSLAPILSSVSLTSNNAIQSTALAKEGDTVTLTFSANEILASSPVVTISGATPTVSGSGLGPYTATYTVLGTDSGALPFTINFEDTTGNAGVEVSSTTSGNPAMTIINGAPVLSNISIASNNVDPALAEVGDIVTVSFTASKTLIKTSPSVASILSNNVAIDGNYPSYSFNYTITESDTEGIIPFSIEASDLAGNISTPYTATNDASSVDFQIPQVTIAEQLVSDNTQNISNVNDLVGQTFLSNDNNTLSTIEVGMFQAGASAVGAIEMKLYTAIDSDAISPKTLIATADNTFDASALSTTEELISFSFTNQTVSLSASTHYFFELVFTGVTALNSVITIPTDSNSLPLTEGYVDGMAYIGSGTLNTANKFENIDLVFRVI